MMLPRKDKEGRYYLSYSQINKWKTNKREYIRQYFFGEPFLGSPYTEFGSKVGEALENNDFSMFSKEDAKFLKTIPRYDEFEKEVSLDMGSFYVKGYIDSNTSDGATIIDYKTGDIDKKKSEYESDSYTQLGIYSAALEQEVGKLPKSNQVVLIGRKGNAFRGESLELTRKFIIIDKKINKTVVNKIKKDIVKVANEISKAYQIYLELCQLQPQ